ncbi:MAG TPA: excinuclease ABC subunit B, partial [Desulfotomaculum sp.]|nr:excinuclease ABC subunit B [Desulfotomaculum sp.]
SERSLIQTIGRAARNVEGKVIMYADQITGSMRRAIDETDRRRQLQVEYNQKNGITPRTIQKAVREVIEATRPFQSGKHAAEKQVSKGKLSKRELKQMINRLEKEMRESARHLEFERAAELRDLIIEMRLELQGKDKRLAPLTEEAL